MKLPYRDRLIVEREKVTEYLLNRYHQAGAAKAAFFSSIGFDIDNWEMFADALRTLGPSGEVTMSVDSQHGSKHIVDGKIESPTGKRPLVRTVWIVDSGSQEPRLVTAYPLDE